MTDRHAGYLVVLDRDIREDDAEESILVALRMIKGVLSVTPVVSDANETIVEMRVRSELRRELWEVLRLGE